MLRAHLDYQIFPTVVEYLILVLACPREATVYAWQTHCRQILVPRFKDSISQVSDQPKDLVVMA